MLRVEAFIEFLEVCVKTSCIQSDDKLFNRRRLWLWGDNYH